MLPLPFRLFIQTFRRVDQIILKSLLITTVRVFILIKKLFYYVTLRVFDLLFIKVEREKDTMTNRYVFHTGRGWKAERMPQLVSVIGLSESAWILVEIAENTVKIDRKTPKIRHFKHIFDSCQNQLLDHKNTAWGIPSVLVQEPPKSVHKHRRYKRLKFFRTYSRTIVKIPRDLVT